MNLKFFDIPTSARDLNGCACSCERLRDAQCADTISTMAEDSDAAAIPATEAVEEVSTPTTEPDMSNDGLTGTEEQEKDPAPIEGAPAEDVANADVTPAKRKSHRPSLEVVEVTVDSFYDKGAFNQELQVGIGTAKTALRI